jgi:hypothetical protein
MTPKLHAEDEGRDRGPGVVVVGIVAIFTVVVMYEFTVVVELVLIPGAPGSPAAPLHPVNESARDETRIKKAESFLRLGILFIP